jgi:flagellar assembly factor FliW
MKNNGESKASESVEIKPYGRLSCLPIHANNIFNFPEGLPAFEHIRQFVFVHKPNTSPFLFMNALEPADLSFVCVDPFLVCPSYAPRIGAADLDYLHVEDIDSLLLLSIVTVTPEPSNITANLQGPLAININACLGRQIVCEGNAYPVRFRIWDTLAKIRDEATPVAKRKRQPVAKNV